MLDTKKKQQIIKKHAIHEGDTGSSEVQIAILTFEIQELIDHLKIHKKDHSSRRGLLRKVNSRRKLMRYLKKENLESHDALMKKLKIKQPKVIKTQAEDMQEKALDDNNKEENNKDNDTSK